jgi:hypothetical protein
VRRGFAAILSMNEDTARSLLRLIAVVTVLVGAILTTMTLVSLLGVNRTIEGAAAAGLHIDGPHRGIVGEIGSYALLAHGSIVVWGGLLYLVSPRLAAWVVK